MVRLRVRQGGTTVAELDASTMQRAEAEAFRYAMQYRKDGDVTIQHRLPSGMWKFHARFGQVAP